MSETTFSYEVIEIDRTFKGAEAVNHTHRTRKPFSEVYSEYDYEIGPGDTLRVNLNVIDPSGSGGLLRIIPQAMAPALTTENLFLIAADGTASIPYAGQIKLGGLKLRQARKKLESVMRQYFKAPQLEMVVEDFAHAKVLITGDVKTPKEFTLTEKPLTIMQALEQVGGLLNTADRRAATLKHANGQSESIDLSALIYGGDESYNKVLQPGDALHIPRNHGNKLFVVGEVKEPQSVILERDDITLTEALDQVKGRDPETTDPSAIYVLREKPVGIDEETEVTVYHLDATDPRAYVYADKLTLQPRDVLFIGTRDITDWGRFIGQLLPAGVAGLVQPAPYILN